MLPVDFIVDAFMYPMDVAGMIYVSELNTSARTITVSADSGPVATGEWTAGDPVVTMYDTSGYARQVGTIVLGDGAWTPLAENPMQFEATATQFVPACAAALNQEGVRGIITDDGKLTTGAILLEGRNGVTVRTYTQDGVAIVRVDVVGCPPAPAVDCDARPDITRILVINEDCPRIIGTAAAGGVINIVGAPGFDAGNLCTPPRLPGADGILPGQATPCDDGTPGTPWPCPPDTSFFVDVEDGQLHIVAPSTLAADNPVSVVNATTPGEIPDLSNLDSLGGLDKIQRRIKHLWDAGIRDRGVLTLKLRRKAE